MFCKYVLLLRRIWIKWMSSISLIFLPSSPRTPTRLPLTTCVWLERLLPWHQESSSSSPMWVYTLWRLFMVCLLVAHCCLLHKTQTCNNSLYCRYGNVCPALCRLRTSSWRSAPGWSPYLLMDPFNCCSKSPSSVLAPPLPHLCCSSCWFLPEAIFASS